MMLSRAYSLVSLYSSLYKDKYNKSIVINKHKEKWGMAEVIDSVGIRQSQGAFDILLPH
jgi:hypothetical protein